MNTESTHVVQGTFKSYLTGYILSLILTAIPFAIVMTLALPNLYIFISLIFLAVAQIIVHLVFFLHMRVSSALYWNWAALIYTVILLGIIVGASIWIMFHLNQNMTM